MSGANERADRVSETTAEGKLASTLSQDEVARLMRKRGEESRWWWIVPTVYIIVLLLPIYWLINMSFKTNGEIVSSLTLYPHAPTIAILLRFMDSFMIYTEAVVLTGGGPGSSTTFLSIDLVKTALGQFDLGPAAAMSIVYFLIVLLLSWVFYTVMTSGDQNT